MLIFFLFSFGNLEGFNKFLILGLIYFTQKETVCLNLLVLKGPEGLVSVASGYWSKHGKQLAQK